jgi:hypothetical protein
VIINTFFKSFLYLGSTDHRYNNNPYIICFVHSDDIKYHFIYLIDFKYTSYILYSIDIAKCEWTLFTQWRWVGSSNKRTAL